VITTVLFVVLGAAFWRNPLRDADSMLLLVVPLVAVPVFLVAALSLLIKDRSTLAKPASFLLWPYWLLLALTFCGRFFEASTEAGMGRVALGHSRTVSVSYFNLHRSRSETGM
jgi:hypothetical protein